MVSLIANGYIRKAIARGFNGRLLNGVLRRKTAASVNTFGDPTYVNTDYPFQGIREDFDAAYRERALIPATDAKILVILGSIKPTSANITPQQNDSIQIDGSWWKVRKVLEVDPARASAELQSYRIPCDQA
jgi:hypothetical protein